MNLLSFFSLLIFIIFEPLFAQESELKVKNFPTIEVTFFGEKKSVECKLDSLVEIYICPNENNPILVRNTHSGFIAIGRDPKDKSAKEFKVKQVQAKQKTLFVEQFEPYFDQDNSKPKEYFQDYGTKVMPLNNFFELHSYLPGSKVKPKKMGSDQYEKLAQTFLEEKKLLQQQANEIATQNSYKIELADGKKISCSRGETNPLDQATKNYDASFETKTQCPIFKCDPVEVNGKSYQATLIYDSNISSNRLNSLHLTSAGEIGPSIDLRRIHSEKTAVPLLDNSFFLNNKHPEEIALPEPINSNRKDYSFFKNPEVARSLKFFHHICQDKDKTLANLLDVKKKMMEKLGQTELVQFISFINDNLTSDYLDPKVAQKMGCFYNGVYVDRKFSSRIDLIKKNFNPDKKVQTISLNKANELFKQAARMSDLAFNYKQDGCYARAHLMARRFEKKGIRVDKVWMKGDLYLPNANPRMGEIQWNFHVAPLVYIQNSQGEVTPMVIDPSLFTKPVTIAEWDKKIAKKTVKGSERTVFPFPNNAAFYERAAIAISTSDVYLPNEKNDLTEKDKMDLATTTVKSYKKWDL